MNLHSAFDSVAYKRLTQVDLPHLGSHQHEINGSAALRAFFGTDAAQEYSVQWYLFEDEADSVQSTGRVKFYDAREKSHDRTGRSEWRLYYGADFLARANTGDVLILTRTPDRTLYGLIFRQNSSWLRAAQSLFGVQDLSDSFVNIPSQDLTQHDLRFSQQQLLEELGLAVSLPVVSSDEDLAVQELGTARQVGRAFPSTSRMSELARSLSGTDSSQPDEALVRWLDREERLFRAIERILVQTKLGTGFVSVDDFITYSLSVQNRRKSRMGYALQNHLEEIFTQHSIRYQPQKATERNHTPDFLFPGQSEYRDLAFPVNRLAMLAAKSSCKERWRQVLDEADRIQDKHLCTLEQVISASTIDDMKLRRLTLVIPADLRATYSDSQRAEILTVSDFIEMIRSKQAGR